MVINRFGKIEINKLKNEYGGCGFEMTTTDYCSDDVTILWVSKDDSMKLKDDIDRILKYK